MKSIKELREQYQVITEKEDKEQRKLTALVRAGLFDAKKLPMLKRALEKGVDKMTPAEKKILIDLLDSLMNQVVSNEPVYMKVKRNVQSMDEEVIAEVAKTPVTIADVPSIVVLKRKAVRVYPGGQQVGLYYSQQLDKYVTIPFGEAGISEEVELDESIIRRRSIEDYLDDRAEETPYDQMTQDQKDRTSPLRVAIRSFGRDTPREAIARTLMSFIQRRKRKGTPLPTKSSKRTRKSPPKAPPKAPPKSSSTKPAKPPKKQTNTTLIKKRNAAQTQQRMKQIKGKNPKATFSSAAIKNAQIKEAVILKLMENHQTNEAVQALIPLAIAAGRAALPYVARGAAAAGPALGRLAGKALTKGKSIGKRLLDKFKGKKGGSTRRGRGRGRGRGRRRDLDLDFDYNAGGNMGGGSSGSQNNQPSYKTPVTHSRTSQLQTNVVGPQYRTSSDAPVDPATARRLQKQFYSQQNESVEINLDGNLVEINNSIAEKLVNVYESLNDYNKQKMVDMLLNEETQHKIVEFVRRY